ncbi:class I SAM-dependent methyltransferase [Melioribacteraceae bacterium 4301-Me]|uniref:class I SAM-dependent methyltransferase n=1 Tax=Pyranulibacter aquaticus TaxID=3163344 RepID=UPI00359B52E1
MKELWNQRYSKEEYIYGKSPNDFFKHELEKIHPGRILLPGEGEGRNAVYAATLGWEVDAVDQSEEGRKKALRLADEFGVKINYTISDLTSFQPSENYYDAVGLIFVHLPSDYRKEFHKKLIASLKPSGKVILEAFHTEQINKNSGGPKEIDMLYSLEDVVEDFIEMDFETLTKETILLNEGELHNGEAVVIRFVGTKLNGEDD